MDLTGQNQVVSRALFVYGGSSGESISSRNSFLRLSHSSGYGFLPLISKPATGGLISSNVDYLIDSKVLHF